MSRTQTWAVSALLAASATMVTGCAGSAASKAKAEAKATASAAKSAAAVSLTEWLDAQYEKELQFSPIALSFQGRKDRNDEIDDLSYEAAMKQLAWKAASVEQMKTRFDYASLTPLEQVSYDVWKYQYEQAAKAAEYFFDGYVFNQMQGPQSFVPTFMINFHRVDDAKDMNAYISRLTQIERAMDQLLANARRGTEEGVIYPEFALAGVIDQAQKVITGAPFTEGDSSDLWADVEAEIAKLEKANTITAEAGADMRARAKAALLDHVRPVYDRIIAWAASEKDNAPEEVTGLSAQPGGVDYYNHLLEAQTTTDLTAEQIHQIGLKEVARLRAEMEKVKAQVKFEGDLDAFFEKVRKADWNYYPNDDTGRQAYITDAKAAIDNIEAQLPAFFNLRPKARLVVKRVEPFREQDGAAQHYFPGTPDGSRPGTYYAHLSDMTAMPKNQLEVIAYHEGIPGHHMQIAIAQELSGVPKFRTQAFFNAYAEGWALYSEYLAKEMPGTYEDPYSELGRLTSEAWRAIRLVVDTGLHAKGWTEQQAIDYFMANSPEPLESVRSEIRRYLVIPGQATTYKIGMMKILELREMAKTTLGDQFDIRGFHDAVLGGGAVPLSVLERQVKSWVGSVGGEMASN